MPGAPPPVSPAPGTRRSPGPCQARGLQRRRERGRAGAPGGGGPKTQARPEHSRFPSPRFHRRPARSGAAEPRKEGADSPKPPRPRPGAPNMSVPIPGKLPGVPGGEGGAPETFPHAFPFSHHPLLPGSLSTSPHTGSWPCPGRSEAHGGAGAAGVTCRESFQLLGAVPHTQGRASGRGQLGAPLLPLLQLPRRPPLQQLPQLSVRSGPSPALFGPHRGLIGSANPRPCACSRRHLPLARPPRPRLPRPSPPGAAADPGTGWSAERELSVGFGRGVALSRLSAPGPGQRHPTVPWDTGSPGVRLGPPGTKMRWAIVFFTASSKSTKRLRPSLLAVFFTTAVEDIWEQLTKLEFPWTL